VKTEQFDAVVIGGGHNGLTCAGYLGRAGLSVKVLEKRKVVGGAAVTEEICPGFRASTCSFVVGLLEPKVIEDLELKRHGFSLIDRAHGAFLPSRDGPGEIMPRSFKETVALLRQHSESDANALLEFDAEVTEVANFVRRQLLKAPPNLGGGFGDLVKAAVLGRDAWGLSKGRIQGLINLFGMSVGDYLDGYFELDFFKGMQAFSALTGNFQSPYAPGTAYGLLHHAWGKTNGEMGKYNYARGGMGAITQAMARSAEEHGVDIETGAGVAQVVTEHGKATGVVLEDGRKISARVVVSNLNPKLLFSRLVDDALLPEDFSKRMKNWRCRSGSFRMNVALSELPDFLGRPGTHLQPHHTCSTFIIPSLAYCERAYVTAQLNGWSEEPIIDMTIPSTIDDSLAPPGQHVATIFVQHVQPELSGGRSWDDEKDTVADHILGYLDQYAPNFSKSVIARTIISPLDLEREWGLVGGDIFHGSLGMDQIFSLRPAAGFADYRMPVKNLYLCGSGGHPGGGVTGAPGHNAAQEVIKDFRRKRV
jgi:phytoene dehydrogenase-like protein